VLVSEDVLGYISSRAHGPVKRAGGWEIHTACWYHGEDPQARGRLYINTDPEAEIPGLHECKVCGAHGSLVSIKKHFGDADEQKD
jgi:hypothetical protein